MNLRERIIQESLRLFSLKGFTGTSITDILTAAGASKGGLYNHFKSKEDIFSAVLSETRKIWREKNLFGLDQIERPVEKIIKFLENYRGRYLKDSENFPGGCIFIMLSVELADQRPHLACEIDKGFIRLKGMINRLFCQAKDEREIKDDISSEVATEIIFSGILGASIVYGLDKSDANLDRTINALIDYLKEITA